jgi:multiple sugar transport system ATP-binding protein
VILGIRPEHINDRAFAADVPGRDELKATVDVMEPVGSEVILIVTVGEHQLTAKIDPHTRASLHQPIELSVDMSTMHLFDKETGEVIE